MAYASAFTAFEGLFALKTLTSNNDWSNKGKNCFLRRGRNMYFAFAIAAFKKLYELKMLSGNDVRSSKSMNVIVAK